MAPAYGAIGREKDANETAKKVLQISPVFSIETQINKNPFAGISYWDYFL